MTSYDGKTGGDKTFANGFTDTKIFFLQVACINMLGEAIAERENLKASEWFMKRGRLADISSHFDWSINFYYELR